jgi:hypothetical protein
MAQVPGFGPARTTEEVTRTWRTSLRDPGLTLRLDAGRCSGIIHLNRSTRNIVQNRIHRMPVIDCSEVQEPHE